MSSQDPVVEHNDASEETAVATGKNVEEPAEQTPGSEQLAETADAKDSEEAVAVPSDLVWEDLEIPSTCTIAHKAVTLPNGLHLIVVQDKETLSSAAAMCIPAGTLQDPPELPGLAHLCEHMLFLGTEKYPTEGEYDKFITTHGGHDNAWTEDTTTNYYCTVASANFFEALDRFIHFFVSPLFTASSLEREVQAVHSEDEKNHNVDYWRMAELWKLVLLNKEHPASRYGNGNQKTLWTHPRSQGVDVRKELLAFYEKNYVANGSSLCVHSPYSPEEVLAAVYPVLSKMKTGERPQQTFNGLNPLAESSRGSWCNLQAVKSMQHLRINFVLPFSVAHYETSPTNFAAHVIGHECRGSIAYVLKEKGWIEELVAGCTGRGIDNDFDNFYIELTLTQEGITEIPSVLELVFQGIELLRRTGYVERLVAEEEVTRTLTFNMTPMGKPHSHAGQLARGATVYTPKRAWCASWLRVARDPKASIEVLDYLTAQNACIVFRTNMYEPRQKTAAPDSDETQETDDAGPAVFAPTHALTTLEPPAVCLAELDCCTEHHKAQYCVGEIPKDWLAKWESFSKPREEAAEGESSNTGDRPPLMVELSLPEPNPYVAQDLDLYPPDAKREPKSIEKSFGETLWRRDLGDHRMPLAVFAISLRSPIAYTSTLQRFFLRVFVNMLEDALTETMYFAELGHLRTVMLTAIHGIEIQGSGPNEKLPILFETLLKEVFTNPLLENKYTIFKQKVRRSLASSLMEQPYGLGAELSKCWTHKFRWSVPEVVESSMSPLATHGNFLDFVAKFRSALRYECLWYGNIPPFGNDETDTPPVVRQCVNQLEGIFLEHKVKNVRRTELPDVRAVLRLPDPKLVPPEPPKKDPSLIPQSEEEECVESKAEGWLLMTKNLNPKDPNCSVEVQFQVPLETLRDKVIADILAAALKSVFFGSLRTSETLGYVVGSACRANFDTYALVFLVQSAAFDVMYVYSRIHAFLSVAPEYLASTERFKDEDFKDIVASLIATKKDKPKTLPEEAARIWGRIESKFGFFHEEEEIKALESVSREEVVKTFETVSKGTKYVVAMYPCAESVEEGSGESASPTALSPAPGETIHHRKPEEFGGESDNGDKKDPQDAVSRTDLPVPLPLRMVEGRKDSGHASHDLYETYLEGLFHNHIAEVARTVRFALVPRRTPLSGKEELELPGYGAPTVVQKEEEEGKGSEPNSTEDNVTEDIPPKSVYFRLIPNNEWDPQGGGVGSASYVSRRQAFRDSLKAL